MSKADFKKMSKDEVKSLYNGLRSGTIAKPENMSADEYALGVKIAKQVSESEYHTYVTTGDLPALKLTQAELAIMSGGAASKKPPIKIVVCVYIGPDRF